MHFPEPNQGHPFGRRKLSRGIAGPAVATVILSMGLTVGVMRFLWQTPDTTFTPTVVLAPKQTRPAVHLTFSTPEPAVEKHGSRRHEQRVGAEGEPAGTRSAALPLTTSQSLQKIVVDDPLLPPPFPTEDDIKVGTPRARLVQAFGKPDLRAHTLHKERLVETYVYEQPERATFVQMQDGSVVAAYTGRPHRVRILPSEPQPDF